MVFSLRSGRLGESVSDTDDDAAGCSATGQRFHWGLGPVNVATTNTQEKSLCDALLDLEQQGESASSELRGRVRDALERQYGTANSKCSTAAEVLNRSSAATVTGDVTPVVLSAPAPTGTAAVTTPPLHIVPTAVPVSSVASRPAPRMITDRLSRGELAIVYFVTALLFGTPLLLVWEQGSPVVVATSGVVPMALATLSARYRWRKTYPRKALAIQRHGLIATAMVAVAGWTLGTHWSNGHPNPGVNQPHLMPAPKPATSHDQTLPTQFAKVLAKAKVPSSGEQAPSAPVPSSLTIAPPTTTAPSAAKSAASTSQRWRKKEDNIHDIP